MIDINSCNVETLGHIVYTYQKNVLYVYDQHMWIRYLCWSLLKQYCHHNISPSTRYFAVFLRKRIFNVIKDFSSIFNIWVVILFFRRYPLFSFVSEPCLFIQGSISINHWLNKIGVDPKKYGNVTTILLNTN